MSSPVAAKADVAQQFVLTPVEAPQAQLPAVVVTPPRPSLLDHLSQSAKSFGQSFAKLGESKRGQGFKLWCNGVGAVAGYAVPAGLLVGAGMYIAGMPPASDVGDWGLGLGAAAAVGQMLAQGEGALGNVKQYKKEGAASPRFWSFFDVMLYLCVPAIGAGLVTGHLYGGEAGLWASVVAGAIGSSVGLTTLYNRVHSK
jgi:hypothetical protein